MAIYKRDIVDINLETGNIHRSFLKHSIGYLDQAADHFGIRVLRNGEPVDLTGVTVQGIFMPPQGNPIAITTGNIIEENVAEVVLPQACYNYDGQFCLSIKLVDATNAITGTMRIVDGMVDNTHASGTVAPTETVPTYQEILSVYADMVTALVTVDELDDEVTDLKSALYSELSPVVLNDWESGSFNTATGENATSANHIRNQMQFGIQTGILRVTSDTEFVFLPRAWDSNNTYIGTLQTNGTFSKTGSNYNNVSDFDCAKYPNYTFKIALKMNPTSSSIVPADGSHCTFHYATDKTLSLENKAADAKTTGAKYTEIRHGLDNYVSNVYINYAQGKLDETTGIIDATNTYYVSTDFIPIDVFYSLYKPIGIRLRLLYYGANKSYLSATGWSYSSSATYNRETITNTNVKYIRLSACIYDGSSVANTTPNDLFLSDFKVYTYKKIDELPFVEYCGMEIGVLNTTSGSTSGSYYDFSSYPYRVSKDFIKINGSVLIEFDSNDLPYITGSSVWKYKNNNGTIEYIGRDSLTVSGTAQNITGENVDYITFTFSIADGYRDREFSPFILRSNKEIKKCKWPNLYHVENHVVEFIYRVSDGVYTKGQIVLPSNYTIDGSAVPLHVYCHGTGGMEKWTTNMTELGEFNLSTQFLYCADEGFATFDCYPWTSKHYKTSRQISPFLIPIHEMAYLEGIKYVCSHFNVDINNVCVSGLSLGGNMARWFAQQTLIPIKSVAFMAPTNSWISLRWQSFFLENNARWQIVRILGLENEDGAEDFVTYAHGINTESSRAFVESHLDSFVGQSIAGLNTSGVTYQDYYNWYITGTTTLPQWMTDLNLPEIPSGMITYGIPTVINHPDKSSYTQCPIKFWQAFDDVNVSAHANYTIYQWFKNGGTEVYWRTLPNNCGGHGATGYSDLAPTASGTTRLGIAYTGIPIAQVEMIDFFCMCIGCNSGTHTEDE